MTDRAAIAPPRAIRHLLLVLILGLQAKPPAAAAAAGPPVRAASVAGASVSLQPGSLDFGTALIGTIRGLLVTLTNSGTAPLTVGTVAISGTNASDFALSTDTCQGATIAVAKSCVVNVLFVPSALGLRSAVMTVADNAADSPQTVSLSGNATGTPPLATAATSGTASVSGTATAILTPAVTVAASPTIVAASTSTATPTPASAPARPTPTVTPVRRVAGLTRAFTPPLAIVVRGRVGTRGTLSVYVRVHTSPRAQVTAALKAVATRGTPSRTQLAAALKAAQSNGLVLLATPRSTKYGPGILLYVSRSQGTADAHGLYTSTVTLAFQPAVLVGVYLSAAARVARATTIRTVRTPIQSAPARPIATAVGRRAPTPTAVPTATMPPARATISGTATPAGTASPAEAAVLVNPPTVQFGTEPIGIASAATIIRVVNLGPASLRVAGVAITGSDKGDFAESDTCTGATIGAYGGCSIAVRFIPITHGPRTAAVTISDNAASSPRTVLLSGTGSTAA